MNTRKIVQLVALWPSSISSPIQQHIQETGHTIDWSEAQILDQDNDWHGRGVRESINIFKIGPVLNRDKGRYKLPKIYHRLLDDGGGGTESDSSSDQEWRHYGDVTAEARSYERDFSRNSIEEGNGRFPKILDLNNFTVRTKTNSTQHESTTGTIFL